MLSRPVTRYSVAALVITLAAASVYVVKSRKRGTMVVRNDEEAREPDDGLEVSGCRPVGPLVTDSSVDTLPSESSTSQSESPRLATAVAPSERRNGNGPEVNNATALASQAGQAFLAPTSRNSTLRDSSGLSAQRTASVGGGTRRSPGFGPTQSSETTLALRQTRDFHAEYELATLLGSGTFSAVYSCTERATGRLAAVKVVDMKRFKLMPSFRTESVVAEFDLLKDLNHPNIISVFDVFVDKDSVMIVSELAKGGELFNRLVDMGNFSEDQARSVLRQTLSALSYLHSRGILHRDLKPENLLLFSRDEANGSMDDPDRYIVKLADFGVARNLLGGEASTFCGSPQYVAPEVLFARDHSGASYGKAVDVWSIGVILYVMLCGYLPFDDGSEGAVADKMPTWEARIKAGAFQFAPPVWTHISAEAKDLITGMLQVEPHKRFTAEQCLQHPWMTQAAAHSVVVAPPVPVVTPLPPYHQLANLSPTLLLTNAPHAPAPAPVVAVPNHSTQLQLEQQQSDHALRMFTVVSKSLNLELLHSLLVGVAKAYEVAYTAVASVPAASSVVRQHAYTSRELLQQVKKILLRFGGCADSVTEVVADIRTAVLAGDIATTQALFERMKQWVDELKQDASTMQSQCNKAIMELQASLEQARTVMGASAAPQLAAALAQIASVHSGPDSAGSSSTTTTTSSSLKAASFVSAASGGAGGGMPTLPSLSPVTRGGGVTALGTPVALPADLSPLEVLFNPAAVVSNNDKLSSALQWLFSGDSNGNLSPASATTPPLSAPDRVVPYLSPEYGPMTAEEAARIGSGAVVSSSSGVSVVVGLDEDGHTSDNTPMPELSLHMDAIAVPATGHTPITPCALTVSPSALFPSTSPVTVAGSAAAGANGLGSALEELRSVDATLSRCVDFWSSMEVVIDVLVRRKDHTAALLKGSGSPQFATEAVSRLDEYSLFWRSFSVLCKQCANKLSVSSLFAFLA